MAISNARHIFQNALGAVPTPEQEKDIDAILRTLQDCGMPVDDRSQAPLIIDLAWRWARIPRNADGRDAVRGPLLNLGVLIDAQTRALQGLGEKIDVLYAGQKSPMAELTPPPIDHAELAGLIAKAIPQQSVKVDLTSAKDAIREAASATFLVFAGLALAAAVYGGMVWKQSTTAPVLAQLRSQVAQQQEIINRLGVGHVRGK